MCLCCRAQCDAGGPLVQSWSFWLMDRFPSGHGILPFCLLTLTCAASEQSLEKLNRMDLKPRGIALISLEVFSFFSFPLVFAGFSVLITESHNCRTINKAKYIRNVLFTVLAICAVPQCARIQPSDTLFNFTFSLTWHSTIGRSG